MTSTLEMANFIHLHALALRKLQSETRQQEHHLRQLLGHVAVLESTDAFECKHYVAPPMNDDKAFGTPQNFASVPPASLVEEAEETPSVEVTECSDDEDDEGVELEDPFASHEDDEGLTSDSSISDDEHEDSDAEDGAEHKLVRCPSRFLGGGCEARDDVGKVEFGKAKSVCRGIATVVDVAGVHGKDARSGEQDQIVSIVEWNDDGF